MKKRKRVSKGSPVRNTTNGECGIVVEIIGNQEDPFGYIVRTATGTKRWVLRKCFSHLSSSKPS
jgi:rRNA processing protein Gar1